MLHVDFQRVDAKTKLHTKVPLHFMNEETNPAVKLSSAVISHVLNEIEIECLPSALPEFLEVDLATIEAVTRCTPRTSSCRQASRWLLTSTQKTRWSHRQRSRLAQSPKATPLLLQAKAKRRLPKCLSGAEQAILSIRFNETVDVTRRGSPRRVFFRFFSARPRSAPRPDGPMQS